VGGQTELGGMVLGVSETQIHDDKRIGGGKVPERHRIPTRGQAKEGRESLPGGGANCMPERRKKVVETGQGGVRKGVAHQERRFERPKNRETESEKRTGGRNFQRSWVLNDICSTKDNERNEGKAQGKKPFE